jgi:membrane protease YdiL (CAAX protease family)
VRDLSKNRIVTVLVTLVGAAVVAALFRFNRSATSYNQYIVGNLIGLFFVPMLTVFFVFRENPDRYGFALTSCKRTWLVVGVLFAALLVMMLAVCRWSTFQGYYPLFKNYPEFSSIFGQAMYPRLSPWVSGPMLLIYAEASYGLYLFCWEFFFRGYLLFGLQRSVGWAAVLLQAIPFGLLHFGKPTTEFVGSFGAGIILGIIALSARSFVPCFVLHWSAAVSFDLLVIGARPH